MAAMLGPGSVSALNYGTRLVTVLLAVGASAMSTAVLPHFSRMTVLEDWKGVRHTLRTYTRLILVVSIPVTGVLIALSLPLARLFFQRGAFTGEATHVVAAVQSFALIRFHSRCFWRWFCG